MLILILVFTLSAAACNKEKTIAGTPGPDDEKTIVVCGLTEQDFEITLGELKNLPVVTRNVESAMSNGEKISARATGPLLDTFLKSYGKNQQDFSHVRFTAKDCYSIAVPADILANREILLSYLDEGQFLADEMGPVRVVVPGERAMYWVRNMIRMDFETGGAGKQPNKLVFLETAARKLPQQDYEHFADVDKAIKTSDLIAAYADINDDGVTNVFLQGADGLQKNETGDNFLNAYIKITGQEAPKFLAPHLPQGMHVRDLLFATYGQTVIFDHTTGMACLPKHVENGREGLAFSQIFKETGLVGGNSYKFTTTGGKSLVLTIADLGSGGLIYQNSQGAPAFTCVGPAGEKIVDDLLSIEILP
ncbi:MAG: molybdopterin-dependent oxidoreductase [Peptococcaceae bacterium]|nr:molybdopterin-dependent oxidoreductase [Candidatus Syntrophopropionicum ammoniitolerans]